MNTQRHPTDTVVSAMNCLEFRRLKLADPSRMPGEATAHQRECPLCDAFARRIDAREERVAATLAVPVPEGLADRVLLRVHHGQRRPWKLMALAASVVLSFGLGLSILHDYPREDYAAFAIEHTLHEPESFTDHRLADPGQFRLALAKFGAELNAPVGEVMYMKLCPVPGGTGWHIVIRTEQGPATLLLIPRKAGVGRETLQAQWGGLNAVALPGGEGYFAVVADSPEKTQAVALMLRQRIRWQT